MTEVFFGVPKLVQLLSEVIERQDLPAGINGKEEAPLLPLLHNDKCLLSSSRIVTAGSALSISVSAGDNVTV